MARRGRIIGSIAVAAVIGTFPLYLYIDRTFMAEPTYRADRLFRDQTPDFDRKIYVIAQDIERGERPSESALDRLGDDIDARQGEGITLLFHAVASANIEAVDALLAAGADPNITDRPTRSDRSFAYLLTLPGGPLMGEENINRMLASYLRHGGDPNATFGDKARSQGNLMQGVAVAGNIEGLNMLLEAGGDPWKPTFSNGKAEGNAMTALAFEMRFTILDSLIDRGYFSDQPQRKIYDFLSALGGYAQRRDEESGEIQRIAKRVLKRNPDYVEMAIYDTATRRIFKDHWKDPEPGVIPWDEILSDAVR
ncbi:ankyrin repeat domain-containing protein [Roseovarius amoyensis]|uniref:ankyrin repeat domain-containing protein n=1 Tax=Roseovarius amoyensis TaxID=2211448 RepID=UPI000DBE6A57|nr:ankyrin repeat domain-containing protein [Roseovarius amoyensis]